MASNGLVIQRSRLDTGGNVLMLTVWRGSRYVNAAVHGDAPAEWLETLSPTNLQPKVQNPKPYKP